MYTESPPLAGRASSARPRSGAHSAYRSADFKKAQFASKKPSSISQIPRTPTRFAMVLVVGVGVTLAWQSYGVEAVRAWAPSLDWLLPASSSGPAVTFAELQQQLKPVAIDLALVRRSEEQLATNQDQLARKQDQMAQAIATLQAAQRDLSQQILALAPSAQKAVHVAPKQVQPPAQ